MNYVSFKECDKIGKKEEKEFAKWADRIGLNCKCVAHEHKKHDFIVEGLRGNEFKKPFKVDVKHRTWLDAVAIEENSTGYRDGWTYTSDSKYIVYSGYQEMMWLDLPRFRQWWATHAEDYREIPNKITDGKFQSSFRRVPIDDIPAEYLTKLSVN